MVAFANAAGGSIFLGVADDGAVKDVQINNVLKSQTQDIAYNRDPSIHVRAAYVMD